MDYVDIDSGKPYTGKLPTSVELPSHKTKPVHHSVIIKSKVGDVDWDESLDRWMWFRGYAVEEIG